MNKHLERFLKLKPMRHDDRVKALQDEGFGIQDALDYIRFLFPKEVEK